MSEKTLQEPNRSLPSGPELKLADGASAEARTATVASGAAKAAELGKEMHLGVEGHSKADNARRLEAAQAVHAALVHDGLDKQATSFPLMSVIKHRGNISELVNDPGMEQDLRDSLDLPSEAAAKGIGEQTLNHRAQGNGREYFDSVVSSLKLKEQYGTDKVLQKAMQAASFAASQQQYPVTHTAAAKNKTTMTSLAKAPKQIRHQQTGLAR